MKIAIHQPEFMPWLGFFSKMALADIYVVFDHVQFKKRYFENRNRIVSPKKEISFIIAPVISKGRYAQAINDVEIDNSQVWKEALLKKIRCFYAKTPYFDKYYEQLSLLIQAKDYKRLVDLNIDLINFFRKNLGIITPMLYSSKMDVKAFKGSELILQICLLNKADIYLCGSSGVEYLKAEEFLQRGIQIEWLNYKSPVYKQLGEGFTADMSTLDLLFNHGEDSLSILMNPAKKFKKEN